MALRVAVASGNWSNPATWNAGIIPAAGDIAASNGFTVTIDQNINVDSITNAATLPVKATPNMTGYTTPSGTVTISTINTSRPGWQAFDGNSGSIGQTNTGGPGWIAYEFTTPIIINAYSWVAGANEQPSNWNFEGWDGSNWIVLHTVTGGSTSYTSPLIGNNTAYIAYRVNVTLVLLAANRPLWYEINLFEKGSDLAAVAGGGFILNNGVTLTCTGTNGVVTGTTTCLTYSGSGVATINASILPANNTAAGVSGLIYSGSGTLNLNGNILNIGISVTRGPTVLFSGTGTLNFTGTIFGLQVNTALSITNTNTCNIVGDIYGGNSGIGVTISGNATVNITGNIFPVAGGSSFIAIVNITAVSAIVNMTGNVFSFTTTDSISHGINLTSNSTLVVVGNVCGTSNSSYSGINATANSYIKVIGTIQAGAARSGFFSTGTGPINILTGPFISHPTGIPPLYVTRMHYQRTLGSYYEFRDNSTNGALPPAGPAPITRLVSPGTPIDAPAVSNVRQGVVYAAGSLTGTMVVPAASNVANNVPVDNTLGTAVLDPNAIWAVPLTSINTLNSIGRRVKNAATVETTGAQIQTTLNNNE
jgi:hypothetical protein